MAGWKPSLEVARSGRASVWDLFASRVDGRPDHIALTEKNRSMTYCRLKERVSALAGALAEQGVREGDRVGVLAHNCTEYVEIELAAARIGAIVAALNWRLAARELSHCIELAEPVLVIAQPETSALLRDVDCPLPPIVETGPAYEAMIDKEHTVPGERVSDPEAGLVILYTSGTTGLPKGALISHRAMIARALCFYTELNLPLDCDFIAWAPFFHMASTDHALATLMRGGTVHVVDGYQPDRLIDLLEQYRVGWFVLMPGVVGEFAEACGRRQVAPKGITVCGAMADLVPAAHIAAVTSALNTPYLNSFGATETGLPPATGSLIPGLAPTDLRKRQSAFCQLRLVDPDDNDVTISEPGEIALRGPTLFSGYWRADETNAHDFRNGWFHMGDVMRRNDDGTLSYVDRVKYMIKSGGENIYPAEIEQVVVKDRRILEAVCVRAQDDKWGEVPVLFVALSDPPVTEEEIMSACRPQLSSYKLPKRIIFIDGDELPRSTTGKVQRHELEALLTAQ